MTDNYETIMAELQGLANPANIEGMARFGIRPKTTVYGISVNDIRAIAKRVGKDHGLAQQLWASQVHEARILASIIDIPKQVTEAQMEQWVSDFDTWDICDQCCGNLFDKTPFAYDKVIEWSSREEEFVKRAAFSLIAYLTTHDKRADDQRFVPFLTIIEREANDERNFVKKAINWALRQIGKRSRALNAAAIGSAERIQQHDSKAARWIATDALRELASDKTQQRLKK
jgi:3-methyladenine DNA glycosylase AlkD